MAAGLGGRREQEELAGGPSRLATLFLKVAS